ncbi:MAG TPA: universal stress protein, partial [Streptosporangiaceae bacterium]
PVPREHVSSATCSYAQSSRQDHWNAGNGDDSGPGDLSDSIAEVLNPASQVKVSATVRQGNAVQVLLDAADGADLPVVGSRGHGGFVEALLGSVAQHCVHHANCPVVVIRDSSVRPTA